MTVAYCFSPLFGQNFTSVCCKYECPFQFRYSSPCDKVLLLIGTLVAVVTGAGIPFLAILMGNMTDSFIKATMLQARDSSAMGTTTMPLTTTMGTTTMSITTTTVNASKGSAGFCPEDSVTYKNLDIDSYHWEDFTDEVIKYCLIYTALGVAVFTAATIQVRILKSLQFALWGNHLY
jgi:hypothetical protein